MRGQAMREVGEADLVVLVEDSAAGGARFDVGRSVDLLVRTKADLGATARAETNAGRTVVVSAQTGEGMEELRRVLDGLAFGAEMGAGGLALNARHVRAIGEAREALGRAGGAIEAGGEVVAMELREALESLGGVLGRMSPDDLLGRIFAGFCIGK
jgi:tRNA modification GTPase